MQRLLVSVALIRPGEWPGVPRLSGYAALWSSDFPPHPRRKRQGWGNHPASLWLAVNYERASRTLLQILRDRPQLPFLAFRPLRGQTIRQPILCTRDMLNRAPREPGS